MPANTARDSVYSLAQRVRVDETRSCLWSPHQGRITHSWKVMAKLGSWLFVAATTLSVAIHVGMKAAGFLRQAAFARKIREIEGVAASYRPTVGKMAAQSSPPASGPSYSFSSCWGWDGPSHSRDRHCSGAVVGLSDIGGLSLSAAAGRVQSAGSSRYHLLIARGIVLILPAKRTLDDWASTPSKLATQLFVLLL